LNDGIQTTRSVQLFHAVDSVEEGNFNSIEVGSQSC
jgi:hypothetical protein